jgi:hypothetical protein
MQTKKISTVIGGLRIALQSLADKLGVTLAIGGSDACTNGDVITLPDLPPEDDTAALLARGYIDHETAHVRHTDFSIPVRPWVNLIEDIRIEKEQGRTYPGCAVNLRQLAAHLKGQGHFRGQSKNPLSFLMSWACCRGRFDVLGQPLGEIADEMETVSRTLFGDLFCDAFAFLVAEIGSCQSTADCDELARRIEHLIQNPPDPPPQPEPGGETDQGPSSDQDEQAGDSPNTQDPPGSDHDSDDEEKEADSKSDSDSPGNEPGSTPERKGNAPGKGAGQDGGLPPTPKQRQALQKAAGADAEKTAGNMDVGSLLKQALGIEHLQAAQKGALEVIPDTHNHLGASEAGDQKPVERELGLDQARRLTAQMRAGLAGLLQAVRLQHSYPKHVGHRIAREAVHRIACATPDTRVFASRRLRQDENTAVVILGDRSGSMGVDKMKVALQAAFVTAEALELLPGVASAVGFFPWGRQVALLKNFCEKPKASRFAIGASGGTPMAEALLWAGMKLSHRKEPRKIVVVMTDGQPDNEQPVRRALERLSACGIETYGIGIQDRYILQWLPEGARVIDRIEELSKALVAVLKEALVDRR